MIIDQNEINEDQLNSILDPMIAKAEEWNRQLSEERKQCKDLYDMAPLGNEQDGFSKVVSDVVWSTVEWSKPALVDIFCHPDFWELRHDDSERSELIKKVIRYQMFSKQRGESELQDWIHNVLLYHNGLIKYFLKEDFDLVKEEYPRLSSEEFQRLQNQGYGVSEHTEVEEFYPEYPEAANVYHEDVKAFKYVPLYVGPAFAAVAPWEFFITPGCKDIKSAPLVYHEVQKTVDDIRKGERLGHYIAGSADRIIDNLTASPRSASATQEITDQYIGLAFNPNEDQIGVKDKESPIIGASSFRLQECYLQYDIDGDGLLEHVIVKKYQDIILSIEENPFKQPPFIDATYHKIPHRFEGRPLPLVLKHDQRELTMMKRIFVDAAAESAYGTPVTSDPDVAKQWEQRSPGVILQKISPNSGFEMIRPPSPDASSLKAIEMIQTASERKTGINSLNQGLDADSYGKTASGTIALQNAGQQMQKFHAKLISVSAQELVKAFILINKLYPSSVQGLPGEKAQIPPDLFQIDDFDIKIDVGVSHNDRMFQAQIYQDHFGKLVQVLIPQGLAGKEHLIKCQQKIGKLQDVPLESLMFDASEVQSVQELMQQNQMMQQQLMQMQQFIQQKQQQEKEESQNERGNRGCGNGCGRGQAQGVVGGHRERPEGERIDGMSIPERPIFQV